MKFFFLFFLFYPLTMFGLSDIENSCLQKIKNNFSFLEVKESCDVISSDALNFFDGLGFSPLGYAIKNNDVHMVEFLLVKGGNPHIRNRHWANGMHIAAIFNAVRIVPILQKAGVSIESQDDEGNTPLMLASERGHIDIVRKLLELGARADHRNQWNQSALSLAAGAGFLNVVQLLEHAGAKIQFFTFMDGRAPIHEAAMYGHTDIVEFFVQKGIDVNIKSSYTGMTPLIYSVFYGNEQVFLYLLKLPNIRVNLWNFQRQTSLFFAVKTRNVKMTKELLSHGAQVGTYDKNDMDVIEIAKNIGDTEIQKILLKFVSH